MICAGIDAGSRAIKIVLLDAESRSIVASAVIDQGVHQDKLATDLFRKMLTQNSISPDSVAHTVATGYGRAIVSIAHTTITEITCHAAGVTHHLPQAATIIDIGGQDSKLLRLDQNGKVRDFDMNDRCAAGTGRFLEVVADRLKVKLTDLGALAKNSKTPAVISSMCVVFAETEIIGLLAAGAAPEDIIAGVQNSIATRVASMAGQEPNAPVVFTGGVAMIPGMDTALAAALSRNVTICPDPQMTGALGAAILAADSLNNQKTQPVRLAD